MTAVAAGASLFVLASGARAQVTEPNGVVVPVTNPMETNLQTYFDTQMEAISAVQDAAVEPGVFLPLCDFQATLVLSQSQAAAGIAWYNVPVSPTAAPDAMYTIIQPTTVTGQVIRSVDVRNDPHYAGGLIGFVLQKSGLPAVYYSEYQRNTSCSGCSMPGYWKMALAYQSKRSPDTYYLAFEDWEGANDTTWFGNDGDFNDKVFQISGVTCDGGGDPCDTAMSGVCAAGVTECQAGGALTCHPQIVATPETCDNLDNDCNGKVDDGDGLCPDGGTCVQGTCIPPCGKAEFDCQIGFQCLNGLCVDAACVGVTCPTGQVCRAGACVGGCEGVTCPLGQVCQLGICVDSCANVACPNGVCELGACLSKCGCRACKAGQVCAPDGQCVDSGCEGVTCPTGQACRDGACQDACSGARCPGGAACHDGVCDMPPSGRGNGSFDGGILVMGSGGSGTILVGTGGTSGDADAGASDAASPPLGSGGARGAGGPAASGEVQPSCACETAPARGPGGALGVVLALWLSRRRRAR